MAINARARLNLYAERWLYGRKHYQWFFDRVHQMALTGLGYGEGNPSINGEYALLDRSLPGLEAPVVLDVGAFEGDWARAVLERSPRATVHAFEPVPDSFARLESSDLACRAHLHRLAISEQDGHGTMTGPAEYLPMSSLEPLDVTELGMTAVALETVTTRRLDTFCREAGVDRIALLKIDTEGHELAVLQGARDLLREGRIEMIQIEVGGTQVAARTYLHDFFELLEPFGYRLYRLLRDGLEPLPHHGRFEIFTYANVVARYEPGT